MIRALILFLALACAGANAKEATSHSIAQESKVEVLYFFSLKCPGCAALRDYVRVWEYLNITKKQPEHIEFYRIPVSTGREGWTEAAQLYFIAKYIEKHLRLPDNKMEILSFQLALEDDSSNFFDIRERLSSVGVDVSDELWRDTVGASKTMLNQAQRVQSEQGVDRTPTFVVNGPSGTTEHLSFNSKSDNPALDLMTRLSGAVMSVDKEVRHVKEPH